MAGVIALIRRFPTVTAFVVLATLGLSIDRDVAWTDDARFYVPAAAAYGDWLARAATFDGEAWSRTGIELAFRNNREHPPVGKYVMAAGWLLFHRWTGLASEVRACRVGVILLWAWMCALVFRRVRRARGMVSGVFAAAALALMPRVLFHGQVETLDLPVAAFLVATFDALLHWIEQRTWQSAVVTVVFFALALGTKLNAPFFLAGCFVFWLVIWPPRVQREGLRLAPVPVVLLGMVVVSPLLVWLMWPWLWFDTMARLQGYLQFHLQHYGIFYYFRGALYGEQVAPWYAPWLMTALTVPLPVLVLALLGSWPPVRALVGHVRSAWRGDQTSPLEDSARLLGFFALLQVLVQLIAVSLPGVPVYGGIKLFLPAFPFLAILAGLGFARVLREIESLAVTDRTRWLVAVAVTSVVLLPGVLGVAAYHGSWLSYYNGLAGGLRGAVASGHERQYYDLAYPELPRTLNALLPRGGSVAVLPNPKEYAPYWARWQREETLASAIRRAPPERADLLVLTHERRWRQYAELQARYRAHRVAAQRTVAGVPLYTIFDLRE